MIWPKITTHPPLKVDRMRHGASWRSTFKGDLLLRGGAQTQKWHPKGPIWVPRPPDECTRGEMGPRTCFPLLPEQNSAKKAQDCQNSKICTRSGLEKGSDESFPPTPEAGRRQKRPNTGKNIPPRAGPRDLFSGDLLLRVGV